MSGRPTPTEQDWAHFGPPPPTMAVIKLDIINHLRISFRPDGERR